MQIQFRSFLVTGLLIGWATVATILGALVWWKVQDITPDQNDSFVPALEEDVARESELEHARSSLTDPEKTYLSPSRGKSELPAAIPLPAIPKVDLPPP